jgi:hypothetical protein
LRNLQIAALKAKVRGMYLSSTSIRRVERSGKGGAVEMLRISLLLHCEELEEELWSEGEVEEARVRTLLKVVAVHVLFGCDASSVERARVREEERKD